jgi:hypothetical protein
VNDQPLDALPDDELYPYATLDDDNRGHEMIGFVVWYLAAFILAASFIIYAALRA